MVKRRPRKSIEQWKAVIADQQAAVYRVLSIASSMTFILIPSVRGSVRSTVGSMVAASYRR